MSICFLCIGMVVGSSLIGLLLGRLIFGGNKKEYISLQEESLTDKSNIKRITHEYNEYKAKTTKRLDESDKELQKVSSQNKSLTRMASAGAATDPELRSKLDKWKKKSETLSKEIEGLKSKEREVKSTLSSDANNNLELKTKLDKWKKKSEILSKEVEILKSKDKEVRTVVKTDPATESQLKDLKLQLSSALKKIRKQDVLLLEAKKESFPIQSQTDSGSKKKGKNKLLAKKYKKKYKRLKAIIKEQNKK